MPTPKLGSARTNTRAMVTSPASPRISTTQKTSKLNISRRPTTATTPSTSTSTSRTTMVPKLIIPRKATASASAIAIGTRKSVSKVITASPRLSHSAASTPRGKNDIKTKPIKLTTNSARTLATLGTVTTTTSKFSAPFKSFVTTGLSMRDRTRSTDFAYDLSKDERLFMGSFKSPMKTVPAGERELLNSGQRGAYLAMRYEHSPDRKYNFPEATSWRIGWLHNRLAKQRSS